jgi:hypothetical protein
MTTEKLIKEYQGKVSIIDESLERILELRRLARRGDDRIDVEDLRAERENASSNRRIYIQIIADLESLQDA